MQLHVGLMADILENPSDDTPRLILADWLEERGDPVGLGLANFIRLQSVQNYKPDWLSDRPSSGPLSFEQWVHAHVWTALTGWKLKGWNVNPPDVMYQLPAGDHFWVTFKKGFPFSLRADWEFLQNHGSGIAATWPIEQVILNGRKPRPYYPEADFDDEGPQVGFAWRRAWAVRPSDSPGVVSITREVNAYNAEMMPIPIFDLLEGGTYYGYAQDMVYKDEETALKAVSYACLKWLKSR
jgi:uncharacterized protein (TIGR02996 family)